MRWVTLHAMGDPTMVLLLPHSPFLKVAVFKIGKQFSCYFNFERAAHHLTEIDLFRIAANLFMYKARTVSSVNLL